MARATGGFRWPPRAPEKQAPAGSPTQPSIEPQPDAPARAGLLRALETMWLAPTAEPLAVRIERAGWAPDEPGDWCDRCGMTVGPYEEDEFGCSGCRDRRLPWDRFVRLGEHAGILREWVHEVKFTRFRALGRDLGALLAERAVACGLDAERVAVVPVPTTTRRRAARGIDHASAIASGVAGRLGAPLVRALTRRHGPSQRAVTPSARAANVSGRFRARRGLELGGWTVALVDDVRTSGATLRACARALRSGDRAGGRVAGIWALTLACAPRPGDLHALERREGSGAGDEAGASRAGSGPVEGLQ